MTTFQPLHDRVAVKRIEAITKTPGGILIPDSATEKPSEGEIVAVGEGTYEAGVKRKLTVKVGDHVLFGKWSGSEIKVNGDDLLVMRESDIIGVLK